MYICTLFLFRIVKEGVQAAGANATNKHIEELSLCGLFLLDACKKADKAFNVPPASTRHTVRDDILTMTRDLLNTAAAKGCDCSGSRFKDPTIVERAAKGWIEAILGSSSVTEEEDRCL